MIHHSLQPGDFLQPIFTTLLGAFLMKLARVSSFSFHIYDIPDRPTFHSNFLPIYIYIYIKSNTHPTMVSLCATLYIYIYILGQQLGSGLLKEKKKIPVWASAPI
jgi:hypothetical protein